MIAINKVKLVKLFLFLHSCRILWPVVLSVYCCMYIKWTSDWCNLFVLGRDGDHISWCRKSFLDGSGPPPPQATAAAACVHPGTTGAHDPPTWLVSLLLSHRFPLNFFFPIETRINEWWNWFGARASHLCMHLSFHHTIDEETHLCDSYRPMFVPCYHLRLLRRGYRVASCDASIRFVLA
jgi:hypothetical protein